MRWRSILKATSESFELIRLRLCLAPIQMKAPLLRTVSPDPEKGADVGAGEVQPEGQTQA